jgi:hypothetical protein
MLLTEKAVISGAIRLAIRMSVFVSDRHRKIKELKESEGTNKNLMNYDQTMMFMDNPRLL